jgi:hypothetical protein
VYFELRDGSSNVLWNTSIVPAADFKGSDYVTRGDQIAIPVNPTDTLTLYAMDDDGVDLAFAANGSHFNDCKISFPAALSAPDIVETLDFNLSAATYSTVINSERKNSLFAGVTLRVAWRLVDVDECPPTGNALCPANSGCRNLNGSYACDCFPAYTRINNTCQDIDECADNATLCGAGLCTNQGGGYRCTCPSGYSNTFGTCDDVDECFNLAICGNHGLCGNQPGSYACLCDPGYSNATNNGKCEDLDPPLLEVPTLATYDINRGPISDAVILSMINASDTTGVAPTISFSPTAFARNAVGSVRLEFVASDSKSSSSGLMLLSLLDGQPPTITILPPGPFTHEAGTAWNLPAAIIASDVVSGTVNPVVDNLVLDALGVQRLRVSASDDSGNTATREIVVNVTDTQAPVITLRNASALTLEVGQGFVDPGVVVVDVFDDALRAVRVPADINIRQHHNTTVLLTYIAQDRSGNHADNITRTLLFVDTQAPVLLWNNAFLATTLRLDYGLASLLDIGLSLVDGSPDVIVPSVVDYNPCIVGDQSVRISASDTAQNTVSQQVVVTLIAPAVPEARLLVLLQTQAPITEAQAVQLAASLENQQSDVCIRFVQTKSGTGLVVGVWDLASGAWLPPDVGVKRLLGGRDSVAVSGFGSVSVQDFSETGGSSGGSSNDNTLLIVIIASTLALLLLLLLIVVVVRRRKPRPGRVSTRRHRAYTNAPMRLSLSHLAATSPLSVVDLDADSKVSSGVSSINTWERGQRPEIQDLYSVALPKAQRGGEAPHLPVVSVRPPVVTRTSTSAQDASEYAEIDEVMGRALPTPPASAPTYASVDEAQGPRTHGYEVPASPVNTYSEPRVTAAAVLTYYQAEPGGQAQAPTIPVYDYSGQVVGFTLAPGAPMLPSRATTLSAGSELYEAMPVRQGEAGNEPTVPIYDQSGAVVDRVTLRKSSAELPWDETPGSHSDTLKSYTGVDTITSFNEGFVDSPSATLPGFRSRSFTTDVTSPAASGRKVRQPQSRLEEVREAAPHDRGDSLRSSEFGFVSTASARSRGGNVLNLDAVAEAPISGVTQGDGSLRLGRPVPDVETGESAVEQAPSALLVPAGTEEDAAEGRPLTCLFGAIPRSTAEQMLAHLPAKSYLVRRKPGDGDNVSRRGYLDEKVDLLQHVWFNELSSPLQLAR